MKHIIYVIVKSNSYNNLQKIYMFISQSLLIMYLTLQNFFLLLKKSFPLEQNNTKLQEYTVYHVCVCYIVSRGLREYSWKQCRPRTRHYSSCTPSHQNVCCRPTVFFFILFLWNITDGHLVNGRRFNVSTLLAATRLFRARTKRVLACLDIITIILFSIPAAERRLRQ